MNMGSAAARRRLQRGVQHIGKRTEKFFESTYRAYCDNYYCLSFGLV